MLEIINYYPWTRLSVIIEAIKRQFVFHMVMHVFDNSNLSQVIFAIDTWRAVIYALGHGRKQVHACDPSDYMETSLKNRKNQGDSYDYCNSQDSQVHTHQKNR